MTTPNTNGEAKYTPGPWEVRDSPSAGLEILGTLGPDEKRRNMVEHTLSGSRPIQIFGLTNPQSIQIAYERWVQFSPPEWNEMQTANAHLIASAPQMFEALEQLPNRIRELSQFVDPKHHEKFHQLAEVMNVFHSGILALARGEAHADTRGESDAEGGE